VRRNGTDPSPGAFETADCWEQERVSKEVWNRFGITMTMMPASNGAPEALLRKDSIVDDTTKRLIVVVEPENHVSLWTRVENRVAIS
jgi:hypothetical protein